MSRYERTPPAKQDAVDGWICHHPKSVISARNEADKLANVFLVRLDESQEHS